METYFVDGSEAIGPFLNTQKPYPLKFHPKLHFLGRSGILTLPHHGHLKIAFLSGTQISNPAARQEMTGYTGNHYTYSDIKSLIDHSKDTLIDILVTSELPMCQNL